MIFSSYRRDDFADPDSFVLQLGLVLEQYPDAVIAEVCSPLTGIQRKSKFPPTIAEIVEFCDAELARREKIRRYNEMGSVWRAPRPSMHRANVFVPLDAPQYSAMAEKAKDADPREFRFDGLGIWVALGWLTEDETRTAKAAPQRFTKEDLEAIYRRHDGEAAE